MIPYLAKGIQDLKDKLKLNDWFITNFFICIHLPYPIL